MNTTELKTKNQPGGAPMDLDAHMKGVTSQIDELGGKIEALEKKAAEAPTGSPVPDVVEKIKADVENFKSNMTKIEGDYTAAVKALTDRIDAVDNRIAVAPAAPLAKSVGKIIHEADQFKALVDSAGRPQRQHLDHAAPISIPSLSGTKATVTPISLTEMGDALITQYRPGILSDAQEVMNLAMRIPRAPVPGAQTYAVRKETAASLTGYVTTTLAVNIDGDPTPKTTCEFTDVDGFVPGTYVRFWNATGGLLKRVQIVSYVVATKVVTFDTDALDFDATAGWRITGENYGAIAESGDKPYSFLEVDVTEHSMKLIPMLMATTNQVLNSVQGMTSWIEMKLRSRFVRNLSWHLMHGDGTAAGQLAGFDNATGAQTYAWSDGTVGDLRTDAIFRAAALIPWTGQIGIVLNKLDLMKIQLDKMEDGHYVHSSLFGNVALNIYGGKFFLGPYEMILDDACIEGDFYAINFAEASELADAQRAELAWGYINDQFATNQITARYEESLLHAINSTAAFVNGEWDSAPT